MSKKQDEQNKRLAFAMWLEVCYLDWQAETKKRATLQEFAVYIGYSRPLISMWMSGKRLPTDEGVKRLADLFGPEIYDLLGMSRPDPDLERLNKIWQYLPEKIRRNFVQQGEKYVTEDNHDEATKPAKNHI